MSAAQDIAAARELLERAERETDPEQKTHHIEEALLLLDTVEDPDEGELRLIANLRTSYARQLLSRLPGLQSAGFDVWLFYVNVLRHLSAEVEALVREQPALAENRAKFVAMWGPEAGRALER